MSALAVDRVTVAPPASLPVDHLSVSSLNLFVRCPEAWKRRYIDHEPERPSGKMVCGGAAGAALVQNFGFMIERGEGLTTEQLLDEFSAELEDRSESEEVDWGTDKPGAMKDSAIGALRIYHTHIAPDVIPIHVEREVVLSWPDFPADLVGYLDMETADDVIVDFKCVGQRISKDKARAELQPSAYLAARRAEGDPAARFEFHTLIRTTKPTAEIVPAPRTEAQLDLLTNRVFSIARAMEWRWLEDCWQGAGPDVAWMCRGCGAADCAWRLG
jgi:hypothetical protein